MKSRIILLVAATLVTGCASVSYSPVQETRLEQLAREGCARAGDRFSVTAQINAAYRETIVLWNGQDPQQTVAVTLPSEGVGSKLRGLVGQSRYELSVERLQQLREQGTPVNVTMRCERKGEAPRADRFSYYENGQRVEFEF